jgi:hypothetical protein
MTTFSIQLRSLCCVAYFNKSQLMSWQLKTRQGAKTNVCKLRQPTEKCKKTKTTMHKKFKCPVQLTNGIEKVHILYSLDDYRGSVSGASESYIDVLYLTVWWGTAVAQWLRYCATNQKVAGSIPDGVIGIFHWHKSFWSHYVPGVDSASNRNDYQVYFLGVNAAGA